MPSRRTVPAWASATAPLALLLTVLATLVGLPASAHAAPVSGHIGSRISAHRPKAAASAPPDPMSVTIDQLTPSTLRADPTKGTIRVSGTITNQDADTWQDINVHAFIGDTPLTTETELTEASLSDPDQDVGHRITSYGDFATIATLAPGASSSYSLTIPRKDLLDSSGNPITAPGAYWFGIQVLGTNTEGRDGVADGRARTFLPLVDKAAHAGATERTAVVVPLRQRVLRQPDGTIANPSAWLKRLSPRGRLADLLDFGADHPVSWLVDPAVIDAVQQLAAGNPPRSLDPTDGTDTGTSPSPSATAAKRAAADDTTTEVAKAWLARLTEVLRRGDVYALPYGDLDLAGSARHDPSLYALARQRSTALLQGLGIASTPIDAPINGYLQPGAFGQGDSATQLLLSDQAISGTVPPVAQINGRTVVTTSSLVASGGPPPGDQLGLVPVRQELLAQAAMRLGTDDPVIAVLPANWSPDSDDAVAAATAGTDFFNGLVRPWLDATTITGATPAGAQQVPASRVRYPDAELEAELPAATFDAVNALRTSGSVLQSVLSHNDAVGGTVLADALTTASYTARGADDRYGEAAIRSREAIDALLRTIAVEAPPAVRLASDRGQFNASVVNGLDQAITIKVKPVADRGMTISAPRKLEIPAHGQAGVRLTAKARTNGVHTVTLKLTDAQGTPLGSQASFPIRPTQVSRIIWVFIAGGIGLLFAAILVRLVRRLRGTRRGATSPEPTSPDPVSPDPISPDPEDG